MLKVDFLSLFPEYFAGPIQTSILGRAQDAGLLEISHVNIRDFSEDKWGRVDGPPAGGGAGMVLQPEPVTKAIRSVKKPGSCVVYLSPQGAPLTASKARELSSHSHLVLLCGAYEGVDERAIAGEVDEEISIGDYVLTNGCLAALVLLDATARFIPGVVGDISSVEQDSFEEGIFDYPQYTKPQVFEGEKIPEVLSSGNHGKIEKWRRGQALKKTHLVRPDLFFRDFTGEISPEKRECVKLSLFLGVTCIEALVRFYRKSLGWALVKSTTFAALLELDGVWLHLKQGYFPSMAVLGLELEEKLFEKLKKYDDQVIVLEEDRLMLQDPDEHHWYIKLKNRESLTKH